VTGFDEATARRWATGAVPTWVPRALAAGWLLATVVAEIVNSPDCTPADPSVCSTDPGYAAAAAALLATPVLLLTAPLLGCLAGVLFTAAELRWETQPVPLALFAGHGAACLAVLCWLLAARRHQAAVAATVPGRLTVPGRPPAYRAWRWGAAVLLLLGAAALVAYGVLVRQDRAHLAAAERVPVRVAVVEPDDSRITVELPGGRQVRLEVVDTAPYQVGGTVPALVDGEWVRLVAEPPDRTLPLAVGVCLIGLAAARAGCGRHRRRALDRLATTGGPAVTVRVRDEGAHVVLWSADGRRAFGRVLLDLPPGAAGGADDEEDDWLWEDDAASWSASDLDGDLVAMTAVGDLRQGGWVALVGDDGARWPIRALQLPARHQTTVAPDWSRH